MAPILALRGVRRRSPGYVDDMLAALLFVVLICVALGIIGVVVHGLFWLFIIGVLVFLGTVFFGGSHFRGRRSRV
jgi:hypothetical protein